MLIGDCREVAKWLLNGEYGDGFILMIWEAWRHDVTSAMLEE